MKLSFFRRHKRQILTLLVSASVLSVAGLAVASGGGEAGAEAGHGVAAAKHWLATDTYKVMNFTVLFVGIFLLIRKPVPELLNNRIKGIKDQLVDLENKKREAEKTLAEYEAKISQLGQEEEKILALYADQAEAAKKKLTEEAAANAKKLEEQAKKNIEHEFKAAKKLLRDEVIGEAMAMAEAKITASINDEDQDRIVDDYLNKVVA